MQIVTDSGTDVRLAEQRLDELNIHIVPLSVTLDGKTYREGVDITTDEFYQLLLLSDQLPTTSQPSVGELAAVYRRLVEAGDPDILSIHISSGLSGTVNAARAAAAMVPEAKVTVIDTKTLSAAAGWQVKAAAEAASRGASREEIVDLLHRISALTDSIYTLKELDYLIHGGRISHIKGLLASILKIKPIIGVEKEGGTYVQMGQARAFKRAITALVDVIAAQHPEGSELRVQVLHAYNPTGAALLRDALRKRFTCRFLPEGTISLVLGAHTGPTMVGVAYASARAWDELGIGA